MGPIMQLLEGGITGPKSGLQAIRASIAIAIKSRYHHSVRLELRRNSPSLLETRAAEPNTVTQRPQQSRRTGNAGDTGSDAGGPYYATALFGTQGSHVER